jgi:gas vesicle protein
MRHAMQLTRFIGQLVKLVVGIFFLNLKDASERIIRTARRVTDSCREVEPKFLKMGNVLQTFYTDLNALIGRVKDTTARMAGAGEENFPEKAAGLSGKARRILDRYCSQAAADLESVDMLIGHLKTLHSACGLIDRIATNLRVVGINIGVECTRSEAARETFRVVAKEIVAFSESIVATGNQIREDAREACIHEENTREKISSGLTELQQLSRDAADVIHTAVGETNSCMAVAEEVFDDSGRRFEEISCQVEEIVTTIQFHDSMRQRLEHVAAALAEVGGQIVGKPGLLGGTAAGVGRLGAAHDVMKVQTGQIQDVIGEIERVHGQGTTAFEKMKSEVALLVRSMASVCDMTSKGSGTDPIVRLIASLRHLVSLIDRADELVVLIEESVTRTAGIAKRFSRHLQKLEKIGVDTHLKAINAIIKSDHLGNEGRTLEVLAQEMNVISRETDHFVISMKERLNQVSGFAENFHGASKNEATGSRSVNRTGKGEKNVEGGGRQLSKSIEAISTDHERLKEQVKGATTDAERLISGIQKTLDELVFLPELVGEMSLHLDQLKMASAAFRQFGNGNRAANSGALQLAESYTMQRERDIHATIVAGQLCEPDIFAAGSPGEGDPGCLENIPAKHLPGGEEDAVRCEEDEAFGENVELF